MISVSLKIAFFPEKTLLRVYVYDDVDRPEFRHGMQPIEKSGQLFFHGGDRQLLFDFQ